ncbi:OmpA family protein [Pendulispora brunnea]|uniref:OmpA family protein n=1 Tax=Pendulispora brunnea TaxID=2905690 RepID=A0ABZ2KHJ7_9BACT
MLKSFLTTFTIGALALALIGGGLYGWVRKNRYEQDLSNERAHWTNLEQKLDECNKAHEQEKASREGSERVAAETQTSLEASRTELEELRAEHAEAEKRLAAFKSITEKFRKMIDSGKLAVTVRHGRMIVKLPAGILFPSGSADLSKDGTEAISDVAHVLRQFPDRRFMVAGHTDNVPIGPPSPFKNNLELSTTRALTVTQQLIKAGMSPARLVAAGYGEYEPATPNVNEASRQENRRIEIVLLPNIGEVPAMPGEDAGAPDASAKDGKDVKDGTAKSVKNP